MDSWTVYYNIILGYIPHDDWKGTRGYLFTCCTILPIYATDGVDIM